MMTGWLLFGIGILGALLPIFPGLPFLILGSAMIGPRNRNLRWLRVQGRSLLRYLSHSRIPLFSGLARIARRVVYHALRLLFRLHARTHQATPPPSSEHRPVS
ncbi:MAG: DUF454 domain-containing protein [Chloroflexaceae bacterium]|nr:DUF454 domain-containing protein [Chloroflexaceae bacterium]NJO05564.1 DUF454 domain-containing protein [Chloroflexaceae bacterium]